jgi:hypothetical protein
MLLKLAVDRSWVKEDLEMVGEVTGFSTTSRGLVTDLWTVVRNRNKKLVEQEQTFGSSTRKKH